jgi:hypothetical protein
VNGITSQRISRTLAGQTVTWDRNDLWEALHDLGQRRLAPPSGEGAPSSLMERALLLLVERQDARGRWVLRERFLRYPATPLEVVGKVLGRAKLGVKQMEQQLATAFQAALLEVGRTDASSEVPLLPQIGRTVEERAAYLRRITNLDEVPRGMDRFLGGS